MSEWDPITESFDVERPDPDDREPDEPYLSGPSLLQVETCLEPGVWMIDGFTVRRLSSHRLWAIYGPCDEFGTAKTLAEAKRQIRNGEVPL